MNPIKRCRVCGEEASGFNYNGLSCESCKVFFHRNHANRQKLKCRNDFNCQILDLASRKKCTRCRLEKCFFIGMEPIPKNGDESKKSPSQKENIEADSSQIILDLNIINEITKSGNDHSEMQFDNCDNADDGVTSTTKLPKKRIARPLNDHELKSIEEVQNAMAVFVDESTARQMTHATEPQQAAQMPDIYFRWVVQYCKAISAFNQLCPEDQFKILKPFCFELLAIRLSMKYVREKKGFPMFRDDTLQETVFIDMETAQYLGKNELIEYNLKFAENLQDEVEDDLVIRDLLCAQFLFKPRDKLSDEVFVRYQHSYYSRLLRAYLEQKYRNILKADKKYLTLMNVVSDIDTLKANERQLHQQLGLQHIPHLVIEMYNLTI